MSMWVTGISAAASIGSSLINKSAADKNSSMINSIQYQPIDLTKLQSDAQATAQQNLQNSLALEQKFSPGVSAARGGLQSQVAGDLASQGALPTDVQNQVSRSAITGANTAGFEGAGGPITAAQLGLTSMNVRNANQQKAQGLLSANPLPVSGLDPGTLASAAIGQNNAENQFNISKLNAVTKANSSAAGANAGLLGSLGSGLTSVIGALGK